MLDGRMLIDAHQHPVPLATVKPAWLEWAQRFGQPGWRDAYSADGVIIPAAFDDLMRAEGVDHSLLICEYSPKATGIQPAGDMLPLTRHNPARFSLLANINPHLHYPVADEVARQAGMGAIGLKVHPVHGGFSPADPALYPAYQFCAAEGLPVVVHCGTSSFPGSSTTWPTPACSSRCCGTSPASPWSWPTAGAAGGTTRRRRWRCCTRTCGSSCPGCHHTGSPTTTRASTCGGWPASSSSAPTGPACPASPATPAPWPPLTWATTCSPGSWRATRWPSTGGWPTYYKPLT